MDIASVILSVVAILISIWTFTKTHRLEKSTKLDHLQEKLLKPRQIMYEVFEKWRKSYPFDDNENFLRDEINADARQNFIDFYNENYHRKPPKSNERLMSNEIHIYLHELDKLWHKYLSREISEQDIRRRFTNSINLDSSLLLTYLEAHWQEHNEHQKPSEKRFWRYVPTIIERARQWV